MNMICQRHVILCPNSRRDISGVNKKEYSYE
jgi:hypothetical protein